MSEMSDETVEALEASIDIWGLRAHVIDPRDPVLKVPCPLCVLFERDCYTGCPVYDKTKTHNCKNTPYHGAQTKRYVWAKRSDDEELADDYRAAAKEELDFLKSLRDK